MKRYSSHNILSHLTLLAIAGSMLSACADYEEILSPLPSPWTQGLAVQPYIEGSEMATRAYNYYDNNNYNIDDDVPADDELMENDLGTHLDVFIAGQGDDPFWMQYHLVQGQEYGVAGVQASVLNETADLLAKKWTDVTDRNGHTLVKDREYDVYVAVNNKVTHDDIANKDALLALTDENEKVYMLYGSTTTGAFDQSRRMLMDGHVKWTCQDVPLQKIEVPLKRAEAKIVATIDISPAFLAQLREETGLETPIGQPMWKYINWCKDTKVFADGNDFSPVLITGEELENMTENLLLDNQPYYYYNGKEMQENGVLSTNTETEVYFSDNIDDTDEYGRPYINLYPTDPDHPEAIEPTDGYSVERTANNVPRARLITYTYTTSWGTHPEERAPYLLVSYPFFRKKNGKDAEVTSANDIITTYNYYRIPVCDEQMNTELKRNYIYKVNAVISGAGSTSFTDNEANVSLHYEVLPWTHSADEDVKVKGEQFHYFYVTPTTYTLRGNEPQSVNLDYYAAKGDVVKFRNLQVYYYNSSGTKVNIYTSSNTENTNGLTTKALSGNNAGRDYSITINSDGTITISSDALVNRAVKYISFQAYMTYVDEEGQTQTLTEDIIIKHFPLDNIQNIEGSWSSKYSSYTMQEQDFTETTYNPAIGETWSGDTGYSKTEVTCNSTDPYITRTGRTAGTINNHNSTEIEESDQNEFQTNVTGNTRRRDANSEANNNNGYWGEDPVVSTSSDYDYYVDQQVSTPANRQEFLDNVPQNRRQNANSASNAVNGYYGSNPQQVNSNQTYDYSSGWRYYKYQSYWHVTTERVYYKYSSYRKYTYWNTTYYRNLYSHTIRRMVPVVNSNWVMWGIQNGTVSDNNFNAKVYYNGAIYNISNSNTVGSRNTIFTNNHMYVIQISSTSDSYVLGRPVIDANYQSQDHVVSPALMIASQLGGLQRQYGNPSDAATHCGQYMEVGTDGTMYLGWRLPTKEEINVIIGYQSDPQYSETIVTVLSAQYYWTLDGTAAYVSTGSSGSATNAYVRCVRDLTADEVKDINSR